MKKLVGIIIGILVLGIAGAVYYIYSPEDTLQVQASSYYGSDATIPEFLEEGTKGTDANPFVLLEIVPYEGYAEIGYMISGCEPVSLDQLTFDNPGGEKAESTRGLDCDWREEFTSTLPVGDTVGSGPGQWQFNAGTGKYSRYRNYFTSKHSFLKNAIGLTESQFADYKIHVITITPDKLNIPAYHGLIERADLIYLSPKSHDLSLVTLWETYHPDKVIANEPTNFYDNDITWDTAVKLLQKAVVDEDPAPIIFDVTIFSSDSSYSGNIVPVKYYSNGVRVSSTGHTGFASNTAKLYLAMQQMDPGKFYREFIATGKVVSVPVKNTAGALIKKDGITMTTGFYKDLSNGTAYIKGSAEAAAVWNIYTFLPYALFPNEAALDSNKAFERLGYKLFSIESGGPSHWSIRHRLYAYNGNNSMTQIFLQSDIYENYYNKEAFDYFASLNGGTRPTALTPAQAIYYLLNTTRGYGRDREKLHILELEPCSDFIWDGTDNVWDPCKTREQDGYNGSSYARQYFSNLFPSYMGKIQITTMTTSEFIGRIEDLNSTYDAVYIGLRDGMLRKDGSGNTIYNETSLNGKVYLHVGDKVKTRNELRGVLGPGDTSDYYRFSGNDITKIKRVQLEKYLASGFPIIFGEGFFVGGVRNSNKIDTSSQIYQLAGVTSSCSFRADALNTSLLVQKLFAPKCRLVFGKRDGSLSEELCYPVLYRDKTKNASLTDRDIYINGEIESNRTLSYQFYIRDASGEDRTYQIGLYIDINADGKFDVLTEKLNNITIRDEGGYEISPQNLKAEVNYSLVTELEESFCGVLPWELQIKDMAIPDNHYSTAKLSALKVSTENKIHINVLQIMADTSNNLKLQEHALFKKYTEELNDYILHFKSITVSQFKSLCGTGPYTYYLEDSNETRNDVKNASGVFVWDDYDGDRLLDVDMLILGLADCYTDIDNVNALNNIKQYINQGKTVLFTHDTTSFFNQPKSSYTGTEIYWGYNLNKKFREAFGMDRFGAVSYSSVAERLAAGKDYAPDGYIQGYSDTNLNRYSIAGQYFNNINFPSSRTITDEYVTKVNQGQLTLYPYEIDDSFKVATTHAQYYQLDMERDDIVVWYCLSDDSVNASGKANGIYSSTPNDVRNNYYIYSKGNITYSGVGHSAIAQSLTNPGAVMETKLFVNTIIAAYSSAAKQPIINITNRSRSVDSSGINYVYVDYDLYATDKAYGAELSGTSQKLKYRVTENNILYNKKLTVEYYDVNPLTGALTLMPLATKKEVTGETVSEIIGGAEYYIEVPLGDLDYSNKGRTTLIRVKLTYGLASEYSLITEKTVTLIRRELFDLD